MTQPDVVLDSPERTVGTAGDYLELMKPRIIMLVVFTFIAGLVAAQSVTGLVINPVLAIVATIAVGLGSGAAGAI
ncbi:MAG: protoheme IX farnesyltransferase, partial [Henriciella sp.]